MQLHDELWNTGVGKFMCCEKGHALNQGDSVKCEYNGVLFLVASKTALASYEPEVDFKKTLQLSRRRREGSANVPL